MDPVVIAASITALPATVVSLATLHSARKTHEEVRTNHGMRAGDYVEQIAADVAEVKTALVVHTQTDAENFAALRAAQAELRKGQTDAVQAIADRDNLKS